MAVSYSRFHTYKPSFRSKAAGPEGPSSTPSRSPFNRLVSRSLRIRPRGFSTMPSEPPTPQAPLNIPGGGGGPGPGAPGPSPPGGFSPSFSSMSPNAAMTGDVGFGGKLGLALLSAIPVPLLGVLANAIAKSSARTSGLEAAMMGDPIASQFGDPGAFGGPTSTSIGLPATAAAMASPTAQATVGNVAASGGFGGVAPGGTGFGGPGVGTPGSQGGMGLGVAPGAGPGAGGPGGASGGTVICTLFHELGIISEEAWKADQKFGEGVSDCTLEGYHFWAKPVVEFLKLHPTAIRVVAPIVKTWSQEMAYQVTGKGQGNVLGKVIMHVGIPLCSFIGSMRKMLERVTCGSLQVNLS